jgi:hypothetical protein
MDDDRAAAGVVAGIIMLGAIVAFLAYMNAAWVPAWVESKEANHAADVSDALATWATDAEDHVARAQTGSKWTVPVPLGVSGLPFLGTGASSGELSVAGAPTLNVSQGSLPVVVAGGGVAMTTHTLRYPSQTTTYALGAMEVAQSDGAWVDLRSMLSVTRATSGRVGLALQTMDLTGAPQEAGGNGNAVVSGTLTAASNQTHADGGNLTIQVGGVHAGAWRAALNRTLLAAGLRGEPAFQADCQAIASTKSYCYTAANNTATQVELVLYDVAGGWTAQRAQVAAEVRA